MSGFPVSRGAPGLDASAGGFSTNLLLVKRGAAHTRSASGVLL
uniref:Uncharacterized protein n=1 Tax=Anguilla anguilla TaxID=7936 RepID=A0A0E9U2X9_ANGAN